MKIVPGMTALRQAGSTYHVNLYMGFDMSGAQSIYAVEQVVLQSY